MIIVEGQARFRHARDIVDFRQDAEQLIRRSREEEGCLDFVVAVDLIDPCMVSVAGKWESWEAFQRHYNLDYVVNWHQQIRKKAIHGHVIQVYDVNEITKTPRTGLSLPG